MAGPVRRGMVRPGGARCGWHGNNNERKGNDMNEIKHMVRTMSHAECVLYEDHVAALKAARNELPDVGSWTPEPKFKVGDRVQWCEDLGTVTEPERELDRVAVSWDDGDYSTVRLSDLTHAPEVK